MRGEGCVETLDLIGNLVNLLEQRFVDTVDARICQ